MAYNKYKENTSNEYAWNKLQHGKENEWMFAILHVEGRGENVVKNGEAFWYIKDDMLVLAPKDKVHLPWIPKEFIEEHKMPAEFKLEIVIARSQLVSVEFYQRSVIVVPEASSKIITM